MQNGHRVGVLKFNQEVELNKAGCELIARGKKGEYLGRLEFTHAGVAVFTGARGKRLLGNLKWEDFFERVAKGWTQRHKVRQFVRRSV